MSRRAPARSPARSIRPYLIGLSGPIGCGKSTVSGMLAEVGGVVIDADALARRATEVGTPALAAIRKRFGSAVFSSDGSLDRTEMARLVFADPAALSELERIVHPPVRRLLETALEEAERDRVPFVAIEAIKLVEGGLAERCDEVWIVECSTQTQRSRLAGRGVALEDAESRIAAQGEGLSDRLAAALEGRVHVRRLSTEGSLERTRELVEDALADALAPLVLGQG